jgi:hypothetical protein
LAVFRSRSSVMGLVVCLALLSVACGTLPAAPDALPTAVAGVVLKGKDMATPVGARPLAQQLAYPTGTPAPWATPLPPTPGPGAPGIPHTLDGNADCLYCHDSPAYFGVPASHKKRTNDTCTGCHTLAARAPQAVAQAIPHTLAGRAACLICHLQGSNGAPVVPASHGGRLNDTCRTCHSGQ